MDLSIVEDLARGLSFALDNVVYSLIIIVYKLFIYLSEINLFSMDDTSPLGQLMGRIYVFLGIFMLFKVTFSLIQYLVDPNSFSDKSKGFGKLVINALVTMILLVSVPFIFEYAMILQNKIITSNAIGTLIMGNSLGSVVQNDDLYENVEVDVNGQSINYKARKDLNLDQIEEMATDLQFLMYGAFFSINPNAKLGESDTVPNVCAETPIFGSVAMAKTGEIKSESGCLYVLKNEFENTETAMYTSGTTLSDFFKTSSVDEKNLNAVSDTRNFSNFGNLLSWRDSDGTYVINYLPLASAAAGLYVVLLLVSFSIDIAVRAIKLCFLEIIAPIAIVSYIDPKESISNSKLRNWIKECTTTYLSLFLRLATIFLVMLLISVLSSSVFGKDGDIASQVDAGAYNIWIYLFLVLGAFQFAKKVPQMIESIFGIKMSGELSLNPFKNPVMAGMAGATIGGIAGGKAGLQAGIEAGAPVRGLGAGLFGGISNGIHNKGSKGLYSSTGNKLYKQLIGNEMKVFNPYKSVMGLGGKNKVEDIKKYITQARSQLNEAQSDLNRTSNLSDTAYNHLVAQGIDVGNLSGETTKIQSRRDKTNSELQNLSSQRTRSAERKRSHQEELEQLNKDIEALTAPGSKYTKEQLATYSAKEAALKAKLQGDNKRIDQFDAEIKIRQQSISQDNKILSDIGTYTDSLKKENELRSEINKIEADIKTLSEEKAQRQTFYGVEDSTKQSVSSAINRVEGRGKNNK